MQKFDVVIVGAGFAGMYALHKLRELGFNAKVIEAGDGVGEDLQQFVMARISQSAVPISIQLKESRHVLVARRFEVT